MNRFHKAMVFGGALVLACAVLGFSNLATAADIFVDNVQGDDRNDGTMPDFGAGQVGPVETIAKALRIAHRGDRVVLANNEGQPYRESITLQGADNSGWPDGPFVIEGNGAILDGSDIVPLDGWDHEVNDIFRFTPARKIYHQLFIDDRPITQAPITNRGELDTMEPLHWALVDGVIYFKAELRRGPGSYRMTYTTKPVGITLYQVRYVTINNLTVQGFQLDGINAHDNADQVVLNNIVARGNGRSGISIGGASRVSINGALIGNNGKSQLRTEGYSKTDIRRSTILDNTAIDLDRQGGEIMVDGQPF